MTKSINGPDLSGSATRRYNDDAVFRQLVDMIEYHLHQATYTPTELRQAVMLAAINFENRRLTRDVLEPTESLWRDLNALHDRIDAATADEFRR